MSASTGEIVVASRSRVASTAKRILVELRRTSSPVVVRVGPHARSRFEAIIDRIDLRLGRTDETVAASRDFQYQRSGFTVALEVRTGEEQRKYVDETWRRFDGSVALDEWIDPTVGPLVLSPWTPGTFAIVTKRFRPYE